jgi:hypothetical protein
MQKGCQTGLEQGILQCAMDGPLLKYNLRRHGNAHKQEGCQAGLEQGILQCAMDECVTNEYVRRTDVDECATDELLA